MYATIRRYASDGGLVDALVEHEDEIRELLTGIDGFQSYSMVRTAEGGAVSISIYDDQAGAEASNAAAAGWVRERVPNLSASPPETSAGDVAVSF